MTASGENTLTACTAGEAVAARLADHVAHGADGCAGAGCAGCAGVGVSARLAFADRSVRWGLGGLVGGRGSGRPVGLRVAALASGGGSAETLAHASECRQGRRWRSPGLCSEFVTCLRTGQQPSHASSPSTQPTRTPWVLELNNADTRSCSAKRHGSRGHPMGTCGRSLGQRVRELTQALRSGGGTLHLEASMSGHKANARAEGDRADRATRTYQLQQVLRRLERSQCPGLQIDCPGAEAQRAARQRRCRCLR